MLFSICNIPTDLRCRESDWDLERRIDFSCGLTFAALSRVISLNGLLLVEKLDWERVKKLGGKFLPLRLEDIACRNPDT
jgi:hypothetical protein